MPGGEAPAMIVINGGCIESVLPPEAAEPGLSVMDVGDRAVLPGLIDHHVHINEPGRTAWEGFETATRAAAAGGVTTLVDMPLNSSPVTVDVAALAAKREASRGKLHVDVGFHGGVVPGHAGDVAPLLREGVCGMKAFLVHSGIDEFPAASVEDCRDAMMVMKDWGVPLLVHAEIDSPVDIQGDPRSYATYLASRPDAWETRAVEVVLNLCRDTGCPVHIVHVASADVLPMLRAAKLEGLPVTAETCPHYLFFDAEDIPDGATQFKCAPPIRGQRHREALWLALEDGTLDMIATDHSPCPPDMKKPDEGTFMSAWGGIASLQVGLSVVWTEWRQRMGSLEQLVHWMSGAPAALCGLEARGAIAPGCRADLCVFDTDASYTVNGRDLFHRHPVTPYEGRELVGRVDRVFLRGREIDPGAKDGSGECIVRGA